MQKPNGYDEAQAGGFTPVDLGGHYATIKQVVERQSSNGKDMIVVLIDFDSNDKQSGYFADQFNNDTRPEKKWAFNGTKYIMVMDFNDDRKTSRTFKTFCTCFEKSNGIEIKWGLADWGKQFAGKKIGVVYGEEENEYDGKTSMRRVIKYFCDYEKAPDAKIPAAKYLSASKMNASTSAPATDPNGFMIPEGIDEEIPF